MSHMVLFQTSIAQDLMSMEYGGLQQSIIFRRKNFMMQN
ncbi:hypothetical protein BN135_2622 [Cronobacter muytjensii 530]